MKTALVTGASRGIGFAAAIELAASGYAVGIGYNASKDAALALVRKITSFGGIAMPCKADVSDADAVNHMVSEVIAQFGHIDVLVTAAGIAHTAEFCDATDTDARRVVDVNLLGTLNCCRAVLPSMTARRSGSIVTVSSVWGIHGASCEAVYSASKAGVIGLTKALAREAGPNGVRVNCVAPGFINTDMTASIDDEVRAEFADKTALGRIGNPEEAAHAICFLASDEASYITGAVLNVDGGY